MTTQPKVESRKTSETEVATDILKSFVDRKKAQGEALEARRQHQIEASKLASTLWDDFDMDDINERVRDYQERTNSGFRTGSNPISFMPGTHQYPFIEVAPGTRMTFREITEGETMRGPRDGGEVTKVKLVVQADGLPGPEDRDAETGDVTGEAVYATVSGAGDLIRYEDSLINNDPVLAEAADREVLDQISAVRDGLMELLGNPQPVAAA